MQTLDGLFAPLVTPFTDDASSVSEIRFGRLMRFLLACPVDGFIVGSDTGEFATLSQSERKTMVELTARDSSGKPFLVHVSSLSTSASLDLAQHAGRHGARAAILMPPFYGTYTADEHIGFFRTVSHHASIPVIVVDPQGLISEDIGQAIASFTNVQFGTPLSQRVEAHLSCYKGLTASDEFALGNCIASPLALLRSEQVVAQLNGETTDLAKLIILEETLGRARVSKAGLEAIGLEVGPPRSPLKPLTGAVAQALRTLLSNAP
jgi:4-hydroxy-tetrahydrodipicolinate synthase